MSRPGGLFFLALCGSLSVCHAADLQESNITPLATNATSMVQSNATPGVAIHTPAQVTATSQVATPGVAAGRNDFPAFKIISERNIFNPNRSAQSARNPGSAPPKQVKVESFALVGTLSSDKGRYAFFDGSSSEYRQALKPAGSIAGYKIARIEPDKVKLEANGQELTLTVGSQMRRQDEGEWRVVAASEATSFGNRNTPSGSAGTNATASGDDNEILKKLMQQREQELNK